MKVKVVRQGELEVRPGSGDKVADGLHSTKNTCFYVLTCDERGHALDPPHVEKSAPNRDPPKQDPSEPKAQDIMFYCRRDRQAPPRDQMEFVAGAARILHALKHLYMDRSPVAEDRFRLPYVRLFHLSRLVLEEGILSVESGKAELAAIEDDLVHDEGQRVKGAHIRNLLKYSGWLGIPALTAYVLLCFDSALPGVAALLLRLHVQPGVLANFMLLWLGSFVGVCLSYALRKPKFTVNDLVDTTGPDLLTPLVRLVFAGTLTMLLVMFSMLNLLDISVGSLKLSAVVDSDQQMLAFVLGVICGISELLLPSKLMSTTLK